MRSVVIVSNRSEGGAYLERVAHSMHSRAVRVDGYSPTDLLFGYNPVIYQHDCIVGDR